MIAEKVSNKIIQRRGSLANIHSAFMSFPEGVSAHFEFYNSILLKKGLPLSRSQSEYLAVETSRSNECPYCIQHHSEAYKVQESPLDSWEKKILKEIAYILTKEPWKSSSLKKTFIGSGFSEEQWSHAVMIISYFNMANRMAFAMNLELETNFFESCMA